MAHYHWNHLAGPVRKCWEQKCVNLRLKAASVVVRVADRIQEAVPGGRTGSGESPTGGGNVRGRERGRIGVPRLFPLLPFLFWQFQHAR